MSEIGQLACKGHGFFEKGKSDLGYQKNSQIIGLIELLTPEKRARMALSSTLGDRFMRKACTIAAKATSHPVACVFQDRF